MSREGLVVGLVTAIILAPGGAWAQNEEPQPEDFNGVQFRGNVVGLKVGRVVSSQALALVQVTMELWHTNGSGPSATTAKRRVAVDCHSSIQYGCLLKNYDDEYDVLAGCEYVESSEVVDGVEYHNYQCPADSWGRCYEAIGWATTTGGRGRNIVDWFYPSQSCSPK